MITFLNFNFACFILFFPYFFTFFSSIFPSSFFLSFFLLHTRTILFSFSFFPPFSPTTSSTLQDIPHSTELSSSFFFFFFFFFLIFFLPFSLFSCHFVYKFLSLYPIKTHKLKGHKQPHHLILIKRR